MRPPLVAIVLVAAALHAAGSAQTPAAVRADRPPLSPQEALASFVLEPGYRIELVAAEPLVQSPVAIAFDDAGRMYVAENRGYPDPLEGEPARPPEGVIARLTDTDGDGRYDRRTEFATGLTYPNGVTPWDGGVFVTAAPDVLYLEDTNGDGVADERRVVLTGFNATNTAQIRVSHPTFAIDNRIYLTSGLNGGSVTSPVHPDRPAVVVDGSDSRFDPRTLAVELVGGRSQFCLTFDAAGRRFTCANRQPLWHVVLEPWHTARNPAYAFSQTTQEVAAFGAAGVVWPISPDLTTASLRPGPRHAGSFTAASGAYVDRGTALAAGHAGSVFICESAQNLVQRQVLTAEGVSFRSRPAREGAEFLASPDTWFRPVFATGGPDGALYVVDMYRAAIDHPNYLPAESRPLFDFRAGRERGRIYRVVASGWRRPASTGTLGEATVQDLVARLSHPNGWQRDTAQRLLIERQDRRAVPALQAMARSDGMPAAMHALWTLEGLGALDDATLLGALGRDVPDVTRHALRLAESRIAATPSLAGAVATLAADDDVTVRLAAALALGNAAGPQAVDALAAIARRDGTDRWVRAAVLSGLANRAPEFLAAFLAEPAPASGVRAAVVQDLGQIFGAAESVDRAVGLVARIADPDGALAGQSTAIASLLRGLRTRKLTRETPSALLALVAGESDAAREARARVERLLARAAAVAPDTSAPLPERQAAIELVGQGAWAETAPRVLDLLDPRQPVEVQVTAARVLAQFPDAAGAADRLLEPARFRGYTTPVREAVLTSLVARDAYAVRLLDAVARGDVPIATIGSAPRGRLEKSSDVEVRDRVRALFAAAPAGGGREALERLQPLVAALHGDVAQGAAVFGAQCRACHAFDGEGGRVGPDLSGLRSQPAEAILHHVLVPDAEIAAGYETYAIDTRDGRAIAGRIESETATTVTVRDVGSAAHAILRSDIASIALVPGSLMPGGFDQALSAQALADLVAYLKSSATTR